MRWLDHREQLPESLRGAIVALGNFDGFHLGHQAVAGEAIAWAREEGRPSIIATFDPHPVRHFKPDAPPFRLTTLEQRQEHYLAAGATAMLVFHFDGELAGTTAEDFVRKLLGEHLGVAGVVTGEDFTFGKARGGNFERLVQLGKAADRSGSGRERRLRVFENPGRLPPAPVSNRGGERRWLFNPTLRQAWPRDCTRGRNVRSRCRCSMCPAIHINSRSWLRPSSTREPSDPPLRGISDRGRATASSLGLPVPAERGTGELSLVTFGTIGR